MGIQRDTMMYLDVPCHQYIYEMYAAVYRQDIRHL